jgi:DNA-binding MarR family transcriptional regulator
MTEPAKPAEIKARRSSCAEETAFVNLLRTADQLSRPLARVLKTEDLSQTQYNVLRILRGAPDGVSCGEIGNRMITRDPDITRLLDRLEKRGMISRSRETKDRRMVLARITAEGLSVLERLDKPVQDAHRKQLGHVGRERLQALVDLLNLCRSQSA